MQCTISHIDTCLPDYVNRHTDVAVPVSAESTIKDVLDGIEEDVNATIHDWTDEQSAAFDQAMMELRIKNAEVMEATFDKGLEPDTEDCCSVYAYFTIEFED
jgi:hypothetical protein